MRIRRRLNHIKILSKRPQSLKIPIHLNSINDVYSSYDDEKLNSHHLKALSTNFTSNNFIHDSSSSMSSDTALANLKAPFRSSSSRNLPGNTAKSKSPRTKSVGNSLESGKADKFYKSYMKSLCLVMSCQKENSSTYRIDPAKLPIDKGLRRRQRSRLSTDGEGSFRMGGSPYQLYNNKIQLVSTDDDDDDDDDVFNGASIFLNYFECIF